MGVLQFKRLFHDQSYLCVIAIHVQHLPFKFNVLGTRNSLKKKTGRINLIKYVTNSNYQAYSNSTLLHETTYLKD